MQKAVVVAIVATGAVPDSDEPVAKAIARV
jgi:hypothetical protein